MSSQGAVHASPVLGNTGSGQRGSGHLAVPSAAWWPDSEPVFKPYARGGTRLRVNQRRRGALRTSASTYATPGKIRRGKARVSSWTRYVVFPFMWCCARKSRVFQEVLVSEHNITKLHIYRIWR